MKVLHSAAELSQLIEAANRVCESNRRQPEIHAEPTN